MSSERSRFSLILKFLMLFLIISQGFRCSESPLKIFSPFSLLDESLRLSEFFCSWTSLGALQCLLAEKTAMGPSDLNKSSTLCWAKSGGVSESWNFDDAVDVKI